MSELTKFTPRRNDQHSTLADARDWATKRTRILGYTHSVWKRGNVFAVTSLDARDFPEGYFEGWEYLSTTSEPRYSKYDAS